MIYNVLLVLGVQQIDWVLAIIKAIIFQVFFHDRLLQDTQHSSLSYILGPCCLSMLYIVMYMLIPNS